MYLGIDARTGKQRYLTRTVRGTKRDAEAVCAELAAEAARGGFGDTAPGTLGELVDRWVDHIDGNVSPSTLASYRNYLRRWILPTLGETKLDRLRPADLDRFYASLRTQLSPSSVRKIHTVIRSALAQAVRWRLLAVNPAASATPPRVETPPIVPPTSDDVTRLLAAAEAEGPRVRTVPASGCGDRGTARRVVRAALDRRRSPER